MTAQQPNPVPLEEDIDALSARVTKQASLVRQLKKDGASSDDIESAVDELQKLKISAEELRKRTEDTSNQLNRKSFDDLALRKMFVVPAFEIHGGVKGLYDLGPPGCAVKVCFFLGFACPFVAEEEINPLCCFSPVSDACFWLHSICLLFLSLPGCHD